MACYLSHTTISCSNAFELSGWLVFADPEGNLFCVLRSEQELQTSG